jgi:long-chain acyl-CoA synthetase
MSLSKTETLQQRLVAVFALDPHAVAIQGKSADTTATWNELKVAGRQIEQLLATADIHREAPIGWLARNNVAAVAAFASLAMNGRMIVPLRPTTTSASYREELVTQRLQAVVGCEEDWRADGAVQAASEAGSLGIVLSDAPPINVRLVPGLTGVGAGPHRLPMPGYVLERLSSGTTGLPKRIPVRDDVLIASLRSGEQKESREDSSTVTLKSSPAILFKPFSHAGGMFGLLMALYQARPMVLFEKFSPLEWAEAVRRYEPKSASLVPAMIRMILEEKIPKESLQSLKAIRVGTAPLDPQTQVEFEGYYGVPLLVDYGAAEFIGGVAGWTLRDHKQYSATKRGSVGRPRADVQLRITSPDTENELLAGQIGLLSIQCDRFGPGWFRTSDLASVDADGFLFLHGRADDAINRGGFKILPEEVAVVLRRFPGIRDAAVVAKADARLGQIPIAVIEMMPDIQPPSVSELDAFVRQHLTAYMVPKEFRFVDALPRTASMKVSRPELVAMLGI